MPHLGQCELLRTPSRRSSQNLPSAQLDRYRDVESRPPHPCGVGLRVPQLTIRERGREGCHRQHYHGGYRTTYPFPQISEPVSASPHTAPASMTASSSTTAKAAVRNTSSKWPLTI